MRAVRKGPQHFRLQLGRTSVEAVVRNLKDGGLLVQVGLLVFLLAFSPAFSLILKSRG